MKSVGLAYKQTSPVSPIGKTRKQRKGAKDRAETKVEQAVRAACVARDGICRVVVSPFRLNDQYDLKPGDFWTIGYSKDAWGIACDGPSELCHMHVRRRSQTRNQAPEIRHDTKYAFMACKKHHDQYDGRARPRLFVTALTRDGADGPLKFRRS